MKIQNQKMKKLNIELKTSEINDMNFIYTSIGTCLEYLDSLLPENIEEEKIRDYYSAVLEVYIESKVSEKIWRQEISKKYNIPYDFQVTNGVVYIRED